jgi:hypothetical protein
MGLKKGARRTGPKRDFQEARATTARSHGTIHELDP